MPAGLSGCWCNTLLCLLLRQEVGILKGLNYNSHIVQFYGACMPPGRDPMLLTEVRLIPAG